MQHIIQAYARDIKPDQQAKSDILSIGLIFFRLQNSSILQESG
jgi:hypothetical protein